MKTIGSHECRNQSTSIVLLGSFNPSIFQPYWFGQHNLIRPSEADTAKVEILSAEVTVLDLNWCKLQVFQDRFVAKALDEAHQQPLLDLVLGVFTLLEHTPIRALGLNIEGHYQMHSEQEWHAFGHYYAPKETWGKLIDHPGLQKQVINGTRKSTLAKRVQVTISPSDTLTSGVFIHVNQHYETEDGTTANASNNIQWALDIIRNEFPEFVTYVDKVASTLLGDALAAFGRGGQN